MTPDTGAILVEQDPQEVEALPCECRFVSQDEAAGNWLTPGALIAERVIGLQAVHFVAERLENARYAVFVVLDDDSEDVLDAVFEAEQDFMRAVPNIAFDLRVRRPHNGWDPEPLLATCVAHYKRRP